MPLILPSDCSGVVPRTRASAERVKFGLASLRIERIAAGTKGQAQRYRAHLEVAADRIDEVAAVALGQLVGAVAEHHEAWRTGVHLGDVAQLDPLAAGRRRRIGIDRA